MWLTHAVHVESHYLGEVEDETWEINCPFFQGPSLTLQLADDISEQAALRASWERLVLWVGQACFAEHLSTGWAFEQGRKPVYRERNWFCGLSVTIGPGRCRFKTNFYCRLTKEVWVTCLPQLPICNTGGITLPITPFLSCLEHIPSWGGNISQLVVI